MKHEIKVPAMGESINEATIAQIMKPSGSHVGVDEEILELETDKVNQVLHAPVAGVLTLTIKPDDVVKIGDVIGFVDAQKETVTDAPKPIPEQAPAPSVPPPSAPAAAPAPIAAPPAPAKPVVTSVPPPSPAGPSARQTKDTFVADILGQRDETPSAAPISRPSVASKTSTEKRPERRVKMSKIRKVIAKRLVESQQSTAMLTTFNEVDLTQVIALRERHKESFQKQNGVKLGFMSFFVKATVSALQAVPEVNAYIDGEDLVYRDYYDIGIAVGTDRGLVVPVVRQCDTLSFSEIEQDIVNYAKKAREGGLTVDDLLGGGFTITNGGTYGSLLSTPILNPPQSGILGMHKIQKRPVVVDDQIVIRPMMYLALSYDHRIVDGKQAVAFLIHIKDALEDPSRMLLGI